jgi:uncharacterized membrane protein
MMERRLRTYSLWLWPAWLLLWLHLIVLIAGTLISRMLHISPLWFQQAAFDSARGVAPGALLAMLCLIRTYRIRLALDVTAAARRARAWRLALQCLALGPLLAVCILTWPLSPEGYRHVLRDYVSMGVWLSTWAFGLFELGRVNRAEGPAEFRD